MGINGSFISDETSYGGLRLQVNYTVSYNTAQSKYILYVTPYLIYPYKISKSSSTGKIYCIVNAGGPVTSDYTSVAVSSEDGGTTQLCDGYNIEITPALHADGTFVIQPIATFVFGGTYNGVYVGTMIAEGKNISLTPPSITGISFTNVGATTAKMTANANFNCNKWEYKVNNGAWTTFSTTNGTSATASLSSLMAGTANTVQVRATRTDLGVTGSATSASVTTLGTARMISAPDVEADASSVSLSFRVNVYSTAYTYSFRIMNGSTQVTTPLSVTFTSTGEQVKTVSLSSTRRNAILSAMSSEKSKTLTYELSTTISGTTTTSTCDGLFTTSEAKSAPAWVGTPQVWSADLTTQDFFDNSDDINNGVINGVTQIGASCLGGATAKNGASIDYYYISVGGTETRSNSDIFTTDPVNYGGSTVEIIYGAVDTRGYEVKVSYTVPVWKYTPMYWQQTDIARANGYDDKITFAVRAKYDPLEATVGGTTYSNVPSTSITLRYSSDNGTTWNTTTLVGANNTTDNTIDYSADALTTPLDIDNTKNVLIELTASDSLSTAPLSLTVPKGVPLIRFEDGKITINGDVEINGNLVVNGTITQNTPSADHTMTISDNGNIDYCYIVDTNGEMPVQYYTNGQTFTVADGNLIKCYVSNMSKRVTVNGVSQTLDSGFYDFTPTSDCTITMTFAIADKSWIDITTN